MNDELDFEKWEAAIGKLILACSRVEYELMRLYDKWLPDRVYHEDAYLSRFDKSIGVAKQSLTNGYMIAELLVQMKRAANIRHLVAHNPIHYSSETDSFHIFDLKTNKDSVCLNDLLSISESVGNISIDLACQLRINV
ncbi:MAG: hypothetical protein ACMZ64_12010 [Oleiphilus sp.]